MLSVIKTFPDLISTASTHARKGNKLKTCTVAVSHAKISGEKGKRQADGSFKPGDWAILRVTGIKSVCSVQDQPAHPKAAMPQAEEVEDEGTLGNAQALLNKWFSNAKTVVVTTQG